MGEPILSVLDRCQLLVLFLTRLLCSLCVWIEMKSATSLAQLLVLFELARFARSVYR